MKRKILLLVFSFVLFIPSVAAATTSSDFCVRTSEIWQFVGYGLFALKIVVPIIIIIFGIIDFAKATVSNDDSAIKKAAGALLRRAVVGVCIFFVPTVVKVIFDMVQNVTETLLEIDACETCLLTPTSEECDGYIKKADDLRNEAS